ncbi:hypothetical protein H112_06564 [Trichophyton rubrum D6]|uniref:J domain-containing protein n=4 Tax=Trichophyton TaxID=5550 RepID=A0A178F182_TRIRU|nr:uncharacterized protein TERG_01923 [Trichophyton rubrum CBS 118892]EZF12762.1 hypothetical protein H100_06581 [Trichophyton rubrum MR850]EZF39210.1 hypothetical protein H102_06548 [Trichophyton rubrum CBS 100081]EZF49857.1 hypothetical protein H103_06573 [Trichophyton rubrum CBS 288.86]EZF71178.1 hypothetical protein H105_06585 [Trichophyton soudanense CBS 452.61]EZF81907.1 hypothetical protein H110_06568 [Trichophyton rubrum MR1448]EZF92569.1 hypothetical protein H113_06618 [Trichophyton 
MAPVRTKHDYYAILEVEQTADAASIRASYRRLARIKHPDKNPTNPNATSEFQLIQEAYSNLFDADARRAYDLRYPSIKRSAGQTETSAPRAEQNTVPTADPRTNGNPDPKSAPAAESRPASKPDHKTEQKPSHKPNPNSELKPDHNPYPKPDLKPDIKPEPKPDTKQDSRTKIKIDLKTVPKRRPVSQGSTAKKHTEDFKATLQQLRAKRASQKDDFLEARRVLGGLQDEVARLSKEMDRAMENIASIGKIKTHRLSMRKIQEIEERKEQAQRTRLDKMAALRLRHSSLEKQEEHVRRCEASYQLTESEIIKVKREIRKEREEEGKVKRRAEEHARQEHDMEATRWGTDDQEATEVMRLWRRREEAEEEENRRHEEEIREARRRYKREAPRKRDIPKQNGCMYGGEWEMIQKPMRCGRCSMGTQRVAFWCPYCGRVSCEACLKFLMGERHDEIVVS